MAGAARAMTPEAKKKAGWTAAAGALAVVAYFLGRQVGEETSQAEGCRCVTPGTVPQGTPGPAPVSTKIYGLRRFHVGRK